MQSLARRRVIFLEFEEGEILRITPRSVAQHASDVQVFFHDTQDPTRQHYAFDELFVTDDPTPKEGMHHPHGVLVLWGKGICQGIEIRHTTNLDFAPTILTLLGVAVPPIMRGRILSEAWQEQATEHLVGDDAAESQLGNALTSAAC
jgi:hypothetical protein